MARAGPYLWLMVEAGNLADGLPARSERRLAREIQQLPEVVGYLFTTWQANCRRLGDYLVRDGWARPQRHGELGELPAAAEEER